MRLTRDEIFLLVGLLAALLLGAVVRHHRAKERLGLSRPSATPAAAEVKARATPPALLETDAP